MNGKNFWCYDGLKIWFFLIIVAAVMCVGFDFALAAPPSGNTVGICLGTVEINKADLSEVQDKDLVFNFSSADEEMSDVFKKYEDSGEVYYRIGENGDWSKESPTFDQAGSYKIYYYVLGDKNHNDLGSRDEPLELDVTVEVSKDDWGLAKYNNGLLNYVTQDGTTSAEVTKQGVIWLKEDSEGSSAWYGLDNSRGTFKIGSRFWVKWLSADKDKEEYQKYFDMLDEEHKKRVEENKLWIFITGVTAPDGSEYSKLDAEVPYYIQLGDDWDREDIRALFISSSGDEVIEDVQFGDVGFFDSKFENIGFPEADGEYARLILKHFSPYAVYDQLDDTGVVDKSTDDENKNGSQERKSFVDGEKVRSIKTGVSEQSVICLFLIFSASLLTLACMTVAMIRDGKNAKLSNFKSNYDVDSFPKVGKTIFDAESHDMDKAKTKFCMYYATGFGGYSIRKFNIFWRAVFGLLCLRPIFLHNFNPRVI